VVMIVVGMIEVNDIGVDDDDDDAVAGERRFPCSWTAEPLPVKQTQETNSQFLVLF
jgi:hypothetical protein